MHNRWIIFSLTIVALSATFLVITEEAKSQSAQILKSKESEIRENMITISRQLGVTCTECHNPNNFRDDAKPSFKVGKDHMRMMEVMRERGFDGKRGPEVTCYMCHRGQLKIDYKEPAEKK